MSFKGFPDFYREYPYKCQPAVTKTVPVPYIKSKDEVCNHIYSLSYKEYMVILKCIFKFTLIYLRQGSKLTLPHRLGYLIVKRYKGTYRDFSEGGVRKKNFKLKEWKFGLFWHRSVRDNGVMTNKWVWRVKLTKYSWRMFFNYYINNFIEFLSLTESVYKTNVEPDIIYTDVSQIID